MVESPMELVLIWGKDSCRMEFVFMLTTQSPPAVHCDEAVSARSSTVFNNSSELKPAHWYEAVSAPPSTAPASVSQSTSTPPPPIQHPSPASVNDENSTTPISSKLVGTAEH